MQLVLDRFLINGKAVIGRLYVDGHFECFTLEDPDEDHDRIAPGTYRVIVDDSKRFGRPMPHVIGSPAIDERGIRIHSGNDRDDTEGCILVGTHFTGTSVLNSHLAFAPLFLKIQVGQPNVTLTVV